MQNVVKQIVNSTQEEKVAESQGEVYSSLSLKSIENKRKLESSIHPMDMSDENKPQDSFSEAQLYDLWEQCEKNYYTTGRMVMASNMQIAEKRLNENILQLEFPSEGTKLSFEENMYDLVSFLRRKLNNYNFQIETIVNEKMPTKKMIFTTEEKVNHLKEKYIAFQELIKVFELSSKD